MSDVVDDLINDQEFIVTLARFADGLTTQAAIKKRYNFTDDVWEQLGSMMRSLKRLKLKKHDAFVVVTPHGSARRRTLPLRPTC